MPKVAKASSANCYHCGHLGEKLCQCSRTITVIESGVNFTNIFDANAEQLLRRAVSMLLTATTFGNNVPKHGAQCKSCDLKYAVKYY
jgi:hypothetical protein